MTLDTALPRALSIDHPVVQAPIGSASTPELAAAVSNAGDLATRFVATVESDAHGADRRAVAAASDA